VLNVLIVDDHPVIRQGLRRHLTTAGDITICAEACTASEVLTQLEQHSCDVVLMDLTLGPTYGLDVVSRIKSLRPHVPIVIYSQHEHMAYVRSALLRGATGYVTKTRPLSEIVTALRYAVKGITYVSPSLEDVTALPYGLAAKPLSRRQQQIVMLRGEGQKAHQIGVTLGISAKTVSAHEEKILEKLQLHSRHQLLQYAARQALK
jgi:two-component system, NarL family, invasion response regulator UvrY